MANYKHGAYGQIQAVGSRVAVESEATIVIIGTAPVHTVEGGAENVNKPILVNNIAEARSYFGYSEDWEKYTLCEAFHVILEQKGVGPLCIINVLDPGKAAHKASGSGTKTLTPANGRITLTGAGEIILDSIKVKTTGDSPTEKVKGTDYTVSYNYTKKIITIAEITSGSLGTAALSVTYDSVKPDGVTTDDIIGTTDGMGLNTGSYAIANVYSETGMIPSFVMAPGWDSIPGVHAAIWQNSQKINGHWDAFIFADMPLTDNGTALTLKTAYAWKKANGYNKDNEKAFFPMGDGTDGKKYHLSVIYAGNFLELLAGNGGVPSQSASNTACAIIRNLWMGEGNENRIYDDKIINDYLCQNGITSAAYVGGRWALWGPHAASYDQEDGDTTNVFETIRMMLYYLSNDFQARRNREVDKALSQNDIDTIVGEEQARLDGLKSSGDLTLGAVVLKADAAARSDMYYGDYAFTFTVTTTPLAKSLTADVNWTEDGYATYFGESEGD